MQITQNVALAPYTTFGIGGPARFFAVAKSIDDVREALAFAKEKNSSVFALGGGSNLLVSDEGFDGLVVKIELTGISIEKSDEHVRIIASAGESWDGVVARAVEEGAWGTENLSGIPGSMGGAVVQNIGAYGAALSETLESVSVLDTKTGEIQTLTNEQCRFGYRGSIFKEEEGRYVVLSATLELSSTPNPNLSYRDLQQRFGNNNRGQTPPLREIRGVILDIRAAKFPDIRTEGTAGSFFKNPIMTRVDAEALKKTYPDMPLFDMPETDGVKVPLAWLLDSALHMKGAHVGGARLFERQVLVIAAARNTSADDVKQLAHDVQKKVFEELKIKIEPEVKII